MKSDFRGNHIFVDNSSGGANSGYPARPQSAHATLGPPRNENSASLWFSDIQRPYSPHPMMRSPSHAPNGFGQLTAWQMREQRQAGRREELQTDFKSGRPASAHLSRSKSVPEIRMYPPRPKSAVVPRTRAPVSGTRQRPKSTPNFIDFANA